MKRRAAEAPTEERPRNCAVCDHPQAPLHPPSSLKAGGDRITETAWLERMNWIISGDAHRAHVDAVEVVNEQGFMAVREDTRSGGRRVSRRAG